jgi:uncharacterized damage-inducible protein DinB
MSSAAAPPGAAWLAISEDEYLWFVDLALDGMVAIVRHLGDDRASRRPDLAGANSPYAILTHCLGVMEFWGGSMVAERAVTRDRAAEFSAEGPVDELIERTAAARVQLHADISGFDSWAAPPNVLPAEDADMPYAQTKGAVLLHVMEELLQHLGQMELTRDVLLSVDGGAHL